MTIVNLDRTNWTAINAGATRIQIFGGRIRVAASATPAQDDWQVFPKGEIVDITAVKFAQAIDSDPTWVVAIPA